MGGGDGKVPGYTGNIDLSQRPVVYNPDGTVSTEKSFSINEDGKEILLPSVINGKVLGERAAIDYYHKTGQHLGVYGSPSEANTVAERVHSRPMSITPDTGAAKYWYVDPTANRKKFDPMSSTAQFQQWDTQTRDNQGHDDVNDALNRLGLLPQGTNPSF